MPSSVIFLYNAILYQYDLKRGDETPTQDSHPMPAPVRQATRPTRHRLPRPHREGELDEVSLEQRCGQGLSFKPL